MQKKKIVARRTVHAEGRIGKSLPRFGFECPVELSDQEGFDAALPHLPVIELIPEGFFYGKRKELLKRLGHTGTPVLGHSVEMSLGSADGFHSAHFESILAVLGEMNCICYSDHLCMTKSAGVGIGQLTTLPFTAAARDATCRNIDKVMKRLDVPFMIENITNRFIVPGCEMSETEFINGVLSRTGAGLLLDLTNLYINSVNFKFDAYDWIDAIRPDTIMGIHLAGGEWEDGVLYDTHSQPVHPEVWDLLSYTFARADPEIVIVEWDQGCPPLQRLMDELAVAEKQLTLAEVVP